MPLASMTSLLADARSHGYALGYFEAWDSYSIEAVVEAAQAERAPVVIGFGCLLVDQTWIDAGGIEMLGCIGRRVSEQADVPVALLLNEAHTLAQAVRGIEAGFNAVMMCTEDTDSVAELAQIAHAAGVTVEGELGMLPDGDSKGAIDHSHASRTDPAEAAAFVAETGVDCLAVSFGNVHTLEGKSADVDLGHLEAIAREVSIPLVVHGGTGFPRDAVDGAIRHGVAKFNIGTALKRAHLEALRAALAALPGSTSPHDSVGSHSRQDLLVGARGPVVELIRALIHLYGGTGRI